MKPEVTMNFGPGTSSATCDYTVLPDLVYKDNTANDGKDNILSKNKLDLFLPKNTNENTPVVIFIHGGGWMRGDRRAYRHFFSCYDTNLLVALALAYYDAYWNVGKAFANAGVACAVVSYRLSRLEFPWLIVELCFSLLMSVCVVLTPLVCLALLTYCLSMVIGCDITHVLMSDVIMANGTEYASSGLAPGMSLFTICALLIPCSLFIVWVIVCQNGEGYFIAPLEKFWPLFVSLLVTCLSLLIVEKEITSVTFCFTLCLGLSLLHSFATLQQTWRPVITHPSHITDVALSVKWINNYGIRSKNFDSNQLFLCGHSAGGHLVSLLALDGSYLKEVGLPLSNIKGVISLSGVYNLHNLSGGVLEYFFLRPAFGSNPETWTTASPYHQLLKQTSIARETNKVFPVCTSCQDKYPAPGKSCVCQGMSDVNQYRTPFLVMNAKRDPLLMQDANQFVAMLTEKEYPCQHVVIKKTNHLSIVLSFGRSQKVEDGSVEEHCLKFMKKVQSNLD